MGTPWVKILPSANLNGIMAWLVVLAVIGIIRMVIRAGKAKAAGRPLTLGDYALGADGDTKIDWSKPAKSFIMALIIFFVMFVGNMSQRILPSTGNEKKDMWRAVIVNSCLTASALFVLLLRFFPLHHF